MEGEKVHVPPRTHAGARKAWPPRSPASGLAHTFWASAGLRVGDFRGAGGRTGLAAGRVHVQLGAPGWSAPGPRAADDDDGCGWGGGRGCSGFSGSGPSFPPTAGHRGRRVAAPSDRGIRLRFPPRGRGPGGDNAPDAPLTRFRAPGLLFTLSHRPERPGVRGGAGGPLCLLGLLGPRLPKRASPPLSSRKSCVFPRSRKAVESAAETSAAFPVPKLQDPKCSAVRRYLRSRGSSEQRTASPFPSHLARGSLPPLTRAPFRLAQRAAGAAELGAQEPACGRAERGEERAGAGAGRAPGGAHANRTQMRRPAAAAAAASRSFPDPSADGGGSRSLGAATLGAHRATGRGGRRRREEGSLAWSDADMVERSRRGREQGFLRRPRRAPQPLAGARVGPGSRVPAASRARSLWRRRSPARPPTMPRRAGSGQLPLPRGWEEVGDYDARSSTSTTTPGGPAGSTPGTGGLPGRGWARGPASEARRRLLSGRPGRAAAPAARGAWGVTGPGCREGSREGGAGPSARAGAASAGQAPWRGPVAAAPSRALLATRSATALGPLDTLGAEGRVELTPWAVTVSSSRTQRGPLSPAPSSPPPEVGQQEAGGSIRPGRRGPALGLLEEEA